MVPTIVTEETILEAMIGSLDDRSITRLTGLDTNVINYRMRKIRKVGRAIFDIK